MMRKYHVRFLGGGEAAMPPRYPTKRRTAECGGFLPLPRRYNRTAVDRLAYGCRELSDDGVSVSLHQTLIQGSAARARGPGRLRDRRPAPEKLIRTPAPAPQNGGLIPERSPS